MNKVRPLYLATLFVLAALLSILVLSPTHAQTGADAVDPTWPTATPLPTNERPPVSPLPSQRERAE